MIVLGCHGSARIAELFGKLYGPEYSPADTRAVRQQYADTSAREVLPTEDDSRILVCPSFPDMQDVINNRVTYGESFRPFAPVVLQQDAPRIFERGCPAAFRDGSEV